MNAPAAWHPDPTGRHEHRYWDGESWTEHVADAGVAATDPLDTGAATNDGTEATSGSDPDGGSRPGPGLADAGADTANGTDSGFAPLSPIEPTSDPGTTQPGATSSGPPAYGAPPSSTSAGPSTGGGYAPPSGSAAPGAGQAGFSSPYGSYPAAAPVGGQPQGKNPMAVTGMILGIASIVLSWIGVFGRLAGILMLLVAIAAIVLSAIGKSRANKGLRGNGMAITGIVTGIIGIIAAGLFLAGGEFWRAFSDEFTELVECIEETGDEEFCQRQFEDRILERN